MSARRIDAGAMALWVRFSSALSVPVASLRLTGLWRHPDFLKFWAGETVSLLGSEVTVLALPLTATILLNADAAQMGILGAAQWLPVLCIGLFAGVWTDRLRRRPIMIACNMGRALVLGVLPIAAVLGLLRMEALYAAAFLLGIGTTFFNVAFAAYLPHVVGRDHLVDGNSRLQASQSLAKTLGPALGGFLVHVFTAPIALLVDATSFVVSLIALASIRVRESSPEPSPQGRNLRRELAEGVQVVVRNSLLVPMIGASALFNVANMALAAVYVLYVTRELGVEPVVLGAIFAAGGPSAVMGAIIASHANRRIGSGVSLILGLLLLSLSQLCVFLAGGSPVLVIGLLVAARVLAGLGLSLNNVNLTVLVQSVTPSESLGRVAAILQFLLVGGLPVGSLIGGALGIAFGIRPTLLLATAWGFLSVVWLLTSPVRSLRSESLATATSHPGKTAH